MEWTTAINGLFTLGTLAQAQFNASSANSLSENAMLNANLMSMFEIRKDAALYSLTLESNFLDKIFSNIQDLISLKNELEERITCILSDYTQLMNQVSLVATLMLIVTSGTLGALLGNTENQVKWKINMFVISCVFTMIISVCSIVESFFTSMLIYESEAKFSAGMMAYKRKPTDETGLRTFESTDLKSINKSFAFVVITFFLSFLMFPFTILSMVYVGLGLSNFDIDGDSRVTTMDSIFIGQIPNTLSSFEPDYVSVALTLTCIIVVFYLIFIWRFFTAYIRWIAWPGTCCGICTQKELLEPLVETKKEYDELQTKLHNYITEWIDQYTKFEASLNRLRLDLLNPDSINETKKDVNIKEKENFLNTMLKTYKELVIDYISESQKRRWNTVKSIKVVNESTKKSRTGRTGSSGKREVQMISFLNEKNPLLF